MSEWTPPHVTVKETPAPTSNRPGARSVRVTCDECGHTIYTWLPTSEMDTARLLDDHLRQHAPGRALDITVDWEPLASCSVCGDGGDIHTVSDGLECRRCGTSWEIDGTCGERAEADDE